MKKSVEMEFEYLEYIPNPPTTPEQMWSQAISNDQITVSTWRDIWINNTNANYKMYGNFADRGLGKLYGTNHHKPAIIAGAGPSLANNVDELKKKGDIVLLSVLHNYHYMVDHGIDVDYYVSLDAGKVTIEEISEGGSKPHEYYVESTKDKKLIAFIGSDPALLASWKGEIYFFTCPIPDQVVQQELDKFKFYTYVSTGGNVLGASMYIAKAILGSNPIAFVGADFCFSYTKQFHPMPSKYDKNIGHALRTNDVFGNKVLTWGSYNNFKVWFDLTSQKIPGIYINCSEGGTLGAYPQGNIDSIRQMTLSSFLWQYNMYNEIKAQCVNPEVNDKLILF